ncbi:hypothetical protein [Oceanospirillum multiglobuliferum]|nr:hypothetical protein [Oceanospirillum multiglobuliferum]
MRVIIDRQVIATCDDNRQKALSLGANDTMTKPEIGKLVNMVDGFLL